MTQPQGTSGRVLADRYRLDSILGSGGMGTVWRAEDEMLGRIVAVKELRMHGGVDEDEKHRLIVRTLREAKATARIRHTAAVTVFDVVEEDDRPWIVMELVDGRSLAEVVKEDGPVTPVRAAEIGLELLGVLGAAHSQGILHRDVKPSNVLIGEDGRVVLTDFGIASVEGDTSVTSTGMLVGAPSYISPERARGHKPGPPADLWSLGGTLYAALEGKPPYDRGSALATLTAVMTEELPDPANAGPLLPVIQGLLEKDPEKRLDASATRSMLRRVVAESTARAESTTQAKVPVTDEPATAVAPAAGPVAGPVAAKAERKGLGKGGARPSVPGLSTVRVGSGRTRPATAATPASAASASASASPAPAAGAAAAEQTAWSSSPTLGAAARWPRRRLLLVALLLALVLVGGGVWLAVEDSGKGTPNGAASTASSAGTAGGVAGAPVSAAPSSAAPSSAPTGSAAPSTAAPTTTAPTSPAAAPPPAGSPAAAPSSPAASASAAGPQVPAGYQLYTDPSGFKIVLPQWLTDQGVGYRATTRKFGGHGLSLLVDWQSPANSSALADWQASDASGATTFSGYQRIQVAPVTYGQWTNAADWEWTFSGSSGTRMHSLNRGFVVDNGKYGYALLWTSSDADWSSQDFTGARKNGFDSFQPAP
ncbi:serine/threonine-protein kinase [Kitasatospora azatica]|uniref:serine/threonine-protein kinase n=1 Tax=Kitasatospora azatica TaxID=58347 RepID=UPI0005633918|nr:serine/threonine-protein kinase [Kitasatospora azatica]